MQKTPLIIASAALAVSMVALIRPSLPHASAAPPTGNRWQAERNYPPLVFHSQATLDCAISSTKNGRQVMKTVGGQGFTFATAMPPIKDGKVQVKHPGMHYAFEAFPTNAIPANFRGLGDGTITEMKAEIEVDVKRYQQPGGPGTDIRFQGQDINGDGAYVEFTGVFVRTRDAKRFPFRVLFGTVRSGGGDVFPASDLPDTAIASKSVRLGTPVQPAGVTTCLYEAEDNVPTLN